MPSPTLTARFEVRSPLAHGSFGADPGNAVPLRREPVVSLPGQPRVPVVSANAVRGILRRILIRELLEAAGVTPTTCPSWERLYAALANGGTLQSPEKRLDPERIRRVRDELPAVSALGAFLYRWTLSGHLRPHGFAWPVCRETVAGGLVPAPADAAPLPVGELVTETSITRLPDTDEALPERTGVTAMPVTFEALATGTTLHLTLGFARHAPPLEVSAVAHGLRQITHLGARGAGGMGHVGVAVEGGPGAGLYPDYLQDAAAREQARECLLWLPSTWGDA